MDINKVKKETTLALIITAVLLFGLYCFVLCPIYINIANDVLFASSFLPAILSVIINIVDILAYAVCVALIIFSVNTMKIRKSASIIACFTVALLMKYIANYVITVVSEHGAIDFDDLVVALLPLVFDAIILCIICIVTSSASRKHELLMAAGTAPAALPFKKAVSLQNPLQKASLVFAVIMTLVKVIPRIGYDISYGVPTSIIDFLWMCLYYFGDILSGFLIYIISVFVFETLGKRYSEQK